MKIFSGDYNLTKVQTNVNEAISAINTKINYFMDSDDKNYPTLTLLTYKEIKDTTVRQRILPTECKLMLVVSVYTGAVDTSVVLPSPSTTLGKIITIKKMTGTAGNIVINAMIDDVQDLTITTQYDSVSLFSNGNQYLKV